MGHPNKREMQETQRGNINSNDEQITLIATGAVETMEKCLTEKRDYNQLERLTRMKMKQVKEAVRWKRNSKSQS